MSREDVTTNSSYYMFVPHYYDFGKDYDSK